MGPWNPWLHEPQIGNAMGAPGSLCFWPFTVDSDLDPVRRKRAISIIRLRAGLLR